MPCPLKSSSTETPDSESQVDRNTLCSAYEYKANVPLEILMRAEMRRHLILILHVTYCVYIKGCTC